MKTKLTIIVQTYNREAGFISCLQSIENQVDKNFKVLIFSNGASYDVGKIAANILKTVNFDVAVEKINRGLVFGRNESIKHVKTDFFARIDDDDHAPADFSRKVNNEISKGHDVIFVNDKNRNELISWKIYGHEPWRYIIKKADFIPYPQILPEDIFSNIYYFYKSKNPSIGKVSIITNAVEKHYAKNIDCGITGKYWSDNARHILTSGKYNTGKVTFNTVDPKRFFKKNGIYIDSKFRKEVFYYFLRYLREDYDGAKSKNERKRIFKKYKQLKSDDRIIFIDPKKWFVWSRLFIFFSFKWM